MRWWLVISCSSLQYFFLVLALTCRYSYRYCRYEHKHKYLVQAHVLPQCVNMLLPITTRSYKFRIYFEKPSLQKSKINISA